MERDGCFGRKGLGSIRKGTFMWSTGSGAMVQVFDQEGRLLYYFGQRGTGPGQFQLPAGLQIDNQDRIYVVDSFNRRVQVFHYYGDCAGGGGEETVKKILLLAARSIVAMMLSGVLRDGRKRRSMATCWACTICRRAAERRCIRRGVWDARSVTLRIAGWAGSRRCGTRNCRRRVTRRIPARPMRSRATRSRRSESRAVFA